MDAESSRSARMAATAASLVKQLEVCVGAFQAFAWPCSLMATSMP